MQKQSDFLKNKSTFCFVLQILFVSLLYRKGDKKTGSLPINSAFTSSWLNV